MWKWLLLTIVLVNSCKTDSDCSHQYKCIGQICQHKELFPLTVYDILGSIAILCASALANASGLGGGPLMTIILIVIFDFHVVEAVPLSQVTVCAGTFIGTLLRIHLRHPTRDRPAIDYELLLLVISPLLLGTTVGVLLEMLITSWLVLGLLTIILSWITFESARASIKSYHKETADRTQPLKTSDVDGENITYVGSDDIRLPLRSIIESEHRIVPPVILGIIIVIYFYNILCFLMQGSSYLKSIVSIPFCSNEYWAMTFGMMSSMILVTVVLSIYLRYRTLKKIMVGYNFDDTDLIWGLWPCSICAVSAVFAGTCAGLLSIGGGIVMSPILLRLGLRAEVVVPTSSILYVLTSSMAVVLYIISGKIFYSYAIVVAGSSLVGSVLGIFGIRALVNKYQRASIMVIAMTLLLALCTIIVPSYGIIHFSTSDVTEFHSSYCPDE